MNYFDTILFQVQTERLIAMRGLPLDIAFLRNIGILPVEYPYPAHDPATQILEPDGNPAPNADGTAYVQGFVVVERPMAVALQNVKTAKLTEFDALFSRLDALKIRPAAAIAEALAAGDPAPTGDAYRLSELEAITAENRALRDTVQAAESVEAVRAVSVWWPGETGEVGEAAQDVGGAG